MLLWVVLFTSFLVVFGSSVMIWWRITETKRNQRVLEGIRANAAPDSRGGRSTVLILPKATTSGIARMFRSKGPAVPADPELRRFALWTAGMALVGGLIGLRMTGLIGAAAPLIGAVAVGALPHFHRARKMRRRILALEDQFPEALEFLARSVRAGNAFSVGLELLGQETQEPLRSEVQKLTRELALGARLEDALNGLIMRAPLVEMRFFASAVLLQRETGGNLSEVLSKLANSLRERLRLRGQVKAASGQGRLTAAVLTMLPVCTLVLMRVASPDYLAGMTGDPMGRNLLAVGGISQFIGYLVMKRISDIEV